MNMKNQFLMFVMLSSLIKGVLHEEEQKTVDETLSVMEGENATLGSGITNIQNNDRIVWIYENTRIAQMNVEPGKISVYDGDRGVFHNKLQLNSETGDLTITYIITYHTGVYQLENLNSGTSKRFMVNVTRLPVPVISKNTSSSSSVSKCVLLCSVMNVTHVSLSWYKGNSLLSSISVSDLNIRLSLHLEVEYQDTNTYTCVINNPITNQTQHLNITHICGPISPAHGLHPIYIALICVTVLVVSIVVAVGGTCYKYKNPKKSDRRDQTTGEELDNLNNVDKANQGVLCNTEGVYFMRTTDCPYNIPSGSISGPDDQQNSGLNDGDEADQPNDAMVETSNLETDSHGLNDGDEVDQPNDGLNTVEEDDDEINDEIKELKDEFKTLFVEEGASVTLEASVIEEEDVIQWRFAESRVNTVKTEDIAERTKANDGKILCSNKRLMDRLRLDNRTGFLTITNITTQDTGHYKLWIPRKRISKTFNVTVNTKV